MDKDLHKDLREARKFVFDTMKKVRDQDLEFRKAVAVNKGAREMANLGKLELEVEQMEK